MTLDESTRYSLGTAKVTYAKPNQQPSNDRYIYIVSGQENLVI
jgi:hypothetical protein